MRYLLLLALAGCPLHSSPPVDPNYDTNDACAVAGDNLRALGCPEANGSIGGQSFVAICVKASELRPLPLGCWSRARDAAEAKACGSLRCVR